MSTKQCGYNPFTGGKTYEGPSDVFKAYEKAVGAMASHVYVSGSICAVTFCAAVQFQDGQITPSINGGLSGPWGEKALRPGNVGGMIGASVGIVTAKPEDQKMQLASGTYADGPIGGTASVGERSGGGKHHQFGWAGGAGFNVQGPTSIWSFAFNPFDRTVSACAGDGKCYNHNY